jgi:hypothetical protein
VGGKVRMEEKISIGEYIGRERELEGSRRMGKSRVAERNESSS